MDLYTHKDYKTAIRERLRELQGKKKFLNLKRLASRVRIQYTYLSKVLNHDGNDLSEDRLFQIAKVLEWGPSETEFLMLMRAHAVADKSEWREELFKKVERLRKQKKLEAEIQSSKTSVAGHETAYLFDPLNQIVLIALCIEVYRKNPRLICPSLGITPVRLKKILRVLADNELIEFDDDGATVKRLLKTHMHFGRDHPLTRVHQALLKSAIQSQLMRTAEEDKHSVLVTFNLDQETFETLKDEFSTFLKRVEILAKKSRDEGVYQINFDLFRWF